MNSKLLFALLMLAILVGFGNSCICVTDTPPHHPPDRNKDHRPPDKPAPSSGCQQPAYTQGVPGPDEYTVIVGIYDNEVRALGQAQKLREIRIHNYCYQLRNGCWVVSVGRYTQLGAARKMRNLLINEFGIERVRIRKPGDIDCRDGRRDYHDSYDKDHDEDFR